jgi:hypothetical protein
MSKLDGILSGLNIMNLLAGLGIGTIFGPKLRDLLSKSLLYLGGKIQP